MLYEAGAVLFRLEATKQDVIICTAVMVNSNLTPKTWITYHAAPVQHLFCPSTAVSCEMRCKSCHNSINFVTSDSVCIDSLSMEVWCN